MGIARGPNLVKDNLVFGYDTGYGVADPGVSTRFFKGKPTVNLQVNGVAAGHNSGNYGNVVTVADAPEKGPRWKKVTISNRGSNFRIIQWTYTTHDSGVVYSHSAEFDWGNMRGKGYYMPFDGSGGGTSVHYINRNYTTGGSSDIDANRQNGHFASTIVKSGGNHSHAWFIDNNTTGVSGLNDYFYYRDYQVEKETEASPFISGTRSSTESLIDLKRTNNIDVSNVSFDSTGQPEFDGTDDKIDITFPTLNSNFGSIEVVVARKDTTTNSFIFGAVGGSTNRYYLRHAGTTSYDACRGNPLASASFGSLTEDKFYHLVMTWNANTIYAYTNGELINTSSYTNPGTSITSGNIGQGSGNHVMADLPVFKIHNQILSATEIKNNFNAYKNRFNI